MTTVSQPFSKSTLASLATGPVVQASVLDQRAGRNLPHCGVRRAPVVFGENPLASLWPWPADCPGPGQYQGRLNPVQSL
jgi:hypothetical protein